MADLEGVEDVSSTVTSTATKHIQNCSLSRHSRLVQGYRLLEREQQNKLHKKLRIFIHSLKLHCIHFEQNYATRSTGNLKLAKSLMIFSSNC